MLHSPSPTTTFPPTLPRQTVPSSTNRTQTTSTTTPMTMSSSPPPSPSMASLPFARGLSLHVTVHIAPENVDKFMAAFKPVYKKVIAEPECLFFEVYQNPQEPGRLSWVENWSKSPDWLLENQLTKDYYKDYLAVTEAMFLKPREFHVLERAGPDFFMVKDKPFPE